MPKLILNCFRQQGLPDEEGDQAGKLREVHGADKSQWNLPRGDPWCAPSITANTGSVLHRIKFLAAHLSNSVSLDNYNLALITISLPPRSRKEREEKGFIFPVLTCAIYQHKPLVNLYQMLLRTFNLHAEVTNR